MSLGTENRSKSFMNLHMEAVMMNVNGRPFQDEKLSLNYLELMGIISTDYGFCQKVRDRSICGGTLKRYEKKVQNLNTGKFKIRIYNRCTKKGCQTYISPRSQRHNFINHIDRTGKCNNGLSLSRILQIVWCWTQGLGLLNADFITNSTRKTTTRWFRLCRRIVEEVYDLRRGKMGGQDGSTVSVDLTRFVITGNPDSGPWICGMSWKNYLGVTEQRYIKVEDDQHLQSTVVRCIYEEIHPGTTVKTGVWLGNHDLPGYTVVLEENPNFSNDGNTAKNLKTVWRELKPRNGICCTEKEGLRTENRLKELWWRSVNVSDPFNNFWKDVKWQDQCVNKEN